MRAIDVMTSTPAVVTPGDSIEHAASLMREWDVGMLPVVEDLDTMRLCGVITDRDIAIRCITAHHDGHSVVRSHMTVAPLHTVGVLDDVRVAALTMEHARVRRLPVVDARHRVVGVIATADLARDVAAAQPRLVADVFEQVSTPALPAAPTRASAAEGAQPAQPELRTGR